MRQGRHSETLRRERPPRLRRLLRLRDIFLMAQPPLLCKEGNKPLVSGGGLVVEDDIRIKKIVRDLLIECDDEQSFGAALVALGVVKPGTASYEQALAAWRASRK